MNGHRYNPSTWEHIAAQPTLQLAAAKVSKVTLVAWWRCIISSKAFVHCCVNRLGPILMNKCIFMQGLSQSANQCSLICSLQPVTRLLSKANKLEVVGCSLPLPQNSKIHKCIQSLKYEFYKFVIKFFLKLKAVNANTFQALSLLKLYTQTHHCQILNVKNQSHGNIHKVRIRLGAKG